MTTPGLTRVGGVVVLHGAAARACLQLTLIGLRSRRLSGLSLSPAHRALAQALADAVAADGQTAAAETPAVTPLIQPTIPVSEAAEMLGLSRRQTRRRAPELGGRRVGRQWLLDEQAIADHLEGRTT